VCENFLKTVDMLLDSVDKYRETVDIGVKVVDNLLGETISKYSCFRLRIFKEHSEIGTNLNLFS
jgi:hypothetical protein